MLLHRFRVGRPHADRLSYLKLQLACEVAAREAAWSDLPQGGRFLPAPILREATSRIEIASRRGRRRAWHLTAKDAVIIAYARIGHRDGAHQSGGVGMEWPFEYRCG